MTDSTRGPADNEDPRVEHAADSATTPPTETGGSAGPVPTADPTGSAQPTAAQPTVPQPGYQAPGYPAQGYGQQPAQHQQPTQPTQPYGVPAAQQASHDAATGTTTKSSPRVGLVIAALAVGALIGGAAGGGGAALYNAGHPTVVSSRTGAQNVTVNDLKNVNSVTAVAAKASPSVVTISVNASDEAGTGSGIVLSSDGYILTNTHVVTLDGDSGNAKISVTDNDGHLYTAKLIGTDPTVDLAVIKLNNASGMTPATFADSDDLNVGDEAIAIGAPLGLSGTVTNGIVSALNRSIQIASSAAPKQDQQKGGNGNGFKFPEFGNGDGNSNGNGSGQSAQQATISLPVVQTDAAINPGNSGGALLNSRGQVIGVNVAIASAGGSSDSGSQSGSIGVGFAIPANLAQRIAGEIMKDGTGSHGLLGATVEDASATNSSDTVGANIVSASPGGAAADAGLKAGDIVTSFNGKPITNATDLTAQVRYLAGGSTAKLTYVRGGTPTTVSVTLGTLSQ